MFFLYSTIYLDTIENTYKRIITIKPEPRKETDITLYNIIKHIHIQKNSPFSSNENRCLIGIKSFENNFKLLDVEEYEELISYLYENNYKIEKNVTKIFNNIVTNNSKKLLCTIVKE